ncbi:MAG: hypothetical protein GWN64_07940 [Candidatus Thorarchaeota archaeon]|nr:hypothetical protein [Candidatus Thorarchaeota archaeon]
MATADEILEVRKNTNTTSTDYDDPTVSELIDGSTVECASATIWKWELAKLTASAAGLKKASVGVESHEFQSLKDKMDYYKGMYEFWKGECQDSQGYGTSALVKASQPEVAGVVSEDELSELAEY